MAGLEEKKENDAGVDKYPLEQIYFYLTEGCNLACRHCWLSPKLEDGDHTYPHLPLDLFRSIIEQGKPLGLKAVKLTGGEPLLHPGIKEIFHLLKEHDLGVTMESNGVLCTPELAEEIAALGKTSVSVSIDGADAETHEWVRGIKGCFAAACRGIKNLVKAGVKPQIICTVMKRNRDSMEAVVRLAESLDAGSVKFNIVQPTGRGEKFDKEGTALTIAELLGIKEWVEDTLSVQSRVKIHFDVPIAFRKLSKMFGKSGDGCATCGILRIIGVLANGSYALCGIGNHVSELVFGHAAQDSLADTWKNHAKLNELREGIPRRFEGICARCHFNRVCGASCIAQNYYRSNSLWEPFWFCEEAYDQGLFPPARIKPDIS